MPPVDEEQKPARTILTRAQINTIAYGLPAVTWLALCGLAFFAWRGAMDGRALTGIACIMALGMTVPFCLRVAWWLQWMLLKWNGDVR